MLGTSRYLLGVAELGLLIGFAALGAARLRSHLLPGFSGLLAALGTAVLALAILLWVAELLGTVGLFKPFPYVLGVSLLGLALRAGLRGSSVGSPRPGTGTETPRPLSLATLIALAIAAVVLLRFAVAVRLRLSTGMTGFDSTWYHAPLAAEFFQTADTFELHFIAPQFLAWFYPANAELFHAIGMLAFHRDILSPLLNLGWLVGCLLALWCVGRPFGVAPLSLGLGAIALSIGALADQAGEARNDLAAIFFLLAAAAIALSAGRQSSEGRLSRGALLLAGLAGGLAAGTKLDYLPAATVLVVGLALLAPAAARWRALGASGLAGLAGGGYWYLRNLVQSGSPLPWVRSLGPISLPAPQQGLGGRESHSAFSYLTDGSVWSHWFLPGLHQGLGLLWPLLVSLAGLGLLLSLGRRGDPVLRVLALAGVTAAITWLLGPTSAEGPAGVPRGFESGLRFLAPALVLGLALLPATPQLRGLALGLASWGPALRWRVPARAWVALGVAVGVVAIAVGGWEQRRYLRDRYATPHFTTAGLDAAFRWARSTSDARIATTSTREYPLYGTDLSNHVQFVGLERPHGGFVAPSSCRAWRGAIDAGHFDYAVVTRDRVGPGRPIYPPAARWTEGPGATVVLRVPPTVVFKLTGRLDPSSCP